MATSAKVDESGPGEVAGSDSKSALPPEIVPEISAVAASAVEKMKRSSMARVDTPLRKSFVRTTGQTPPPLATFFRKGGRGAEADLKVYLVLLWRCSTRPFTTEISARQIAQLLDLEDPAHKGARRVAAALERLQERRLVKLTPRRGESSIIEIRHDSGDGSPYSLPSGKVPKGKAGPNHPDLYAKVPYALWRSGHMQKMSAPALAMLLILLEEGAGTRDVWFSTDEFPARYRLTPSVRARGTKELMARRLLMVKKQLVESGENSYGREKVRNVYKLRGEAAPAANQG